MDNGFHGGILIEITKEQAEFLEDCFDTAWCEDLLQEDYGLIKELEAAFPELGFHHYL